MAIKIKMDRKDWPFVILIITLLILAIAASLR